MCSRAHTASVSRSCDIATVTLPTTGPEIQSSQVSVAISNGVVVTQLAISSSQCVPPVNATNNRALQQQGHLAVVTQTKVAGEPV